MLRSRPCLNPLLHRWLSCHCAARAESVPSWQLHPLHQPALPNAAALHQAQRLEGSQNRAEVEARNQFLGRLRGPSRTDPPTPTRNTGWPLPPQHAGRLCPAPWHAPAGLWEMVREIGGGLLPQLGPGTTARDHDPRDGARTRGPTGGVCWCVACVVRRRCDGAPPCTLHILPQVRSSPPTLTARSRIFSETFTNHRCICAIRASGASEE